MDKYLLVPLEDTVVFPNMTVNLPLDAGRRDARPARAAARGRPTRTSARSPRSTRSAACPAAAPSSTLTGQTRALLGAAETQSDGRLFVEVEERPDETPPPVKTRELETEYRAIVEEILELRRANRAIGEFLRSITEPGALADTCAYAPDLTLRAARRAAGDARRRRAARARDRASSASGSRSCRCAAASTTTSSPARRSSSASTSCASRWSRSARSSARTTAPSSTSTARRSTETDLPEAVREQAERELGRLERMGEQLGRVAR